MANTIHFRVSSNFKVLFKGISLIFLLIVATVQNSSLYSQIVEIKSAIESISKYTNIGTDRTSKMLAEVGFIPPENLKSAWDGFPAVRKIETAFMAAESGSGERMLALLSSNLAQQYESIRYEKSLAQLLRLDNIGDRISFTNTSKFEVPKIENISLELRESIISITKYSDARALGGTRGILKYNFNLADNKVYEILRSSDNNFEALLQGIQNASIPPSQKERLTFIVKELQNSYEAAKVDIDLNKIYSAKFPEKMPQGTALTENNEQNRIYDDYKRYNEKHFKNEKLKSFENMKKDIKSFGGIVFGNKVTTGASLVNKKLKYIKWIYNGFDIDSTSTTGILEFEFADGSIKIASSILLEDAYAAYKIMYGDSSLLPYKEGDGIGLAGADHLITDMEKERYYAEKAVHNEKNKAKQIQYLKYIEYLNNYDWNSINDSLNGLEFFSYEKCTLHPAIANLELGRSLMRCDVWLRTCDSLKTIILNNKVTEIQKKTLSTWLVDCNKNGWKFTDAPVSINSDRDYLSITPNDAIAKDSYIRFRFQTSKDTTYKNFQEFYSIVPLLTSSLFDFERLNTFAKVLSLVRWARQNNAIFLNKPGTPPLVRTPIVIHANPYSGIKLFDSIKEVKQSYGYKADN